jgi:hypothetical protein
VKVKFNSENQDGGKTLILIFFAHFATKAGSHEGFTCRLFNRKERKGLRKAHKDIFRVKLIISIENTKL